MKKKEVEKKTGIKRFSVCLMNPPYLQGLHLKFLEKVIEVSDNVVSIQPVTWLQDQLGKRKEKSQYYKYKETISEHIKDIEIINWYEAMKLFGIQSDDLAIYICDKNGGYDYNSISSNPLLEDVMNYIDNNLIPIEHNKKDGYRIRISLVSGASKNIKNLAVKDIVFKDGKYNGKWWYQYYQKNKFSKSTEEISASVKFDSEEEAHNFVKSFNVDFVRYIESFLIVDKGITPSKILWMGNAKHPRTGNKGYKTEWTNNDFYEYFNVNEEYKNIIKDYIEKNKK